MDQSGSTVEGHASTKTDTKEKSKGEPMIFLLTEKMFSEEGETIALKTTVIPETKVCFEKERLLFCELTNEYHGETKYETTRLACLLVKNGIPQWSHLMFSNAMAFSKSIDSIIHIEIKDTNDKICEKIPARILKRKNDLNQSDRVQKGADTDKKNKKPNTSSEQTQTSDLETNQTQMASASQQNHPSTEYLMSPTTEQLQQPNFVNEFIQPSNYIEHPIYNTDERFHSSSFINKHTQYSSSVQYRTDFTGAQHQDPHFPNECIQYSNPDRYPIDIANEQYLHPNVRNEHMQWQNRVGYSLPITRVPRHDSNLNEYVTSDSMVNLYPGIENTSSLQETSQLTTPSSYLNTSENSNYGNFLSLDQQETSSQGTPSLPSFNSLFTRFNMDITSETSSFIGDVEVSPDTQQLYQNEMMHGNNSVGDTYDLSQD